MTLPDPRRSTAVLIGTAAYAPGSRLPALPAVRFNLQALHALLTSPHRGGFTADAVTVIDDPSDPRTVLRQLREASSRADDVFLVYFAGHGLRDFDIELDDLYLAMRNTDEHYLDHTALALRLLKRVFRDDVRARKRVLILDCCFSGRAIEARMGHGAGADPTEFDVQGTYVLASAAADQSAVSLPGATYTAFTGALVSILRDGVPAAPDPLPLNAIYPVLTARLRQQGLPVPRQYNTDTAADIALTHNTATSSATRPHTNGQALHDGAEHGRAPSAGTRFEQRHRYVMFWRAITAVTAGFIFLLRNELPQVLRGGHALLLAGIVTAGLFLRYRFAFIVDKQGVAVRRTRFGPDDFRYNWTSVAQIQLRMRPRRWRRDQLELQIVTESGVPRPSSSPLHRFNRYNRSRDIIRFAPLGSLADPVHAIDEALRRYAGPRWLPPAGTTTQSETRVAVPSAPFTAQSWPWWLPAPLVAWFLAPAIVAASWTGGFGVTWTPGVRWAGLMVLPTFVAQIALATACLRPARLRIDDDGIAVRDRGTQQHLPWPVIAEVGLVPHATRIFWKAAITIRLHDNPESPHVLLGLHRLRTSKEAVERALRHHAGTAWNPDLHTDTGLRHNDDSAVVASGRYSGPLTHALGFLGLILFMVQTFLADPAQQTNSPVLVATAAFCYISELIMIIFMPVLALFADPLTVTVSRTGISIRRWPLAKTIPWTSVRHIAIEDGALLVWPSADTAKTRRNPFRGLPDQGGGVVLCRLNERREHLNVSAVTLDQALARFAGPRHLPRFSSPQSRARLQ